MSRVLRLRRGSTAETSAFTGKLAEVTVDTDTFSLVVHDNVTPGGYRIATESYVESNKAVTSTGSTAPSQDVTEGSMWFDSVSGRLYVRYSNVWIDANPTVENNTIGNLLIDDTTIRTTDNANLYLSPNGSGVVIANITGTLTGNVTGNVTGSISGSAATVRTAAQPNITSVGTLTALTVSTPIVGDITGRANTANTANAANTANTVTTAAQPNITSVGTLSSLTVSANVTAGNVTTNDYYNSSGPGLVMHGNVIPASNVAYNLGAPGNEWNSLYISDSTIYLGGVALSIDNTNNLTVGGNPVGSGALAPSSSAPGSASEGQLWFDVEDGHLYVRYANVWVDTTIGGSSRTRIGDTYASGAFQQLTIADDEGKLITIAGGNSLFRLPQITANSLGIEFEFYFSADAGQVYLQAYYTDNRNTTDKFVGSVFVGVDNATTGRLHTATSHVADANYLFLGQHHAKAGSYIKFKAIAFDTVGTWLVQGQCVGDAVNTTPNGQSYIFQNYYD